MVGLYCQGGGGSSESWLTGAFVWYQRFAKKSSPPLCVTPGSSRSQIVNGSSRFVNVTSGCYIVTLLRLCFPTSSSIFSNKNCL